AVGLLMAIWFVSGIVMMYVGYPQLQEAERLRVQTPIPWQECCRFGERLVPDDQAILRAQVETHAGGAAPRRRPPGQPPSLRVARGSWISIDPDVAKSVAAAAAPRIVGRAAIVAHERIDVDQWTVGRYVRDRPLHRFDFDDPAGTSIYVSGTAGQIVLWTTAT